MNQEPDPDLIQISSLIHDVDDTLLRQANEHARTFHRKWAFIFATCAVVYALLALLIVHPPFWKAMWLLLAAAFVACAVHAYRKSVYYARKT